MNDIRLLQGPKRRQNHNISILVSQIGRKIPVETAFYVSDTCYFAGMTLVHPDGCHCDEDYERARDARQY
jgi:hypothetical protein